MREKKQQMAGTQALQSSCLFKVKMFLVTRLILNFL
jgi:hypothetical protein